MLTNKIPLKTIWLPIPDFSRKNYATVNFQKREPENADYGLLY